MERSSEVKEMRHACNVCDKTFTRKSSLIRHQRTGHGTSTHQSPKCKANFNRRDNFLRHISKHHPNRWNQIEVITNQIGGGDHRESNDAIPLHAMESENTNKVQQDDEHDCITKEEAIDGNLKKISISATDNTKYNPMSFLKAKEEKIISILRDEVRKRLRIKFYMTLQVRLTKTKGDQVEVMEPFFHGRCHIVLKLEDIEVAMRESMKKMFTSFLEFQRQGSNWTVDKVMSVNIHIVNYKPIKGSSFIPLPVKLAAKKAIVNVQNNDNKCFMWSVLAALYPAMKDPQRVTKYIYHQDRLNFTNIPFPVRVADVQKFEKLNNISINVFGYEKQELYP